MGWRETCAVDERMRIVMAAEKSEERFAALCRLFGVSRKAGYKWLARYQDPGVRVCSIARGRRTIIRRRLRTRSLAGQKPAVEVNAPHIVGRAAMGERRVRGR